MYQIKNLRDVTSNILENMFFLYEETVPDQYNQQFAYCTFINDPSLKIKMMVTEKLGKSLAQNFLGTDIVDQNDVLDVIKEILNMIIGNYIGKYSIKFEHLIPVPQSIFLPKDYLAEEKNSDIIFYESEPLLISVEP
jgi:hypothetical protein